MLENRKSIFENIKNCVLVLDELGRKGEKSFLWSFLDEWSKGEVEQGYGHEIKLIIDLIHSNSTFIHAKNFEGYLYNSLE